MDSRDNFRERLEALEQRTAHWRQQTRTVERRLRWWRGLACGVLLVSLASLPLPAGLAKEEHPDKDNRELRQRVKLLEAQINALEDKLAAVTFDATAKELVITGANLRIVNGLGRTDCGPIDDQMPGCPNGLGNLIVGYNESRVGSSCIPSDFFDCSDTRTGSHNVVVGSRHNFSRFGGIVVGQSNTISGDFASVSGGSGNTAGGLGSSVSSGVGNTALGEHAWAGGGQLNLVHGLLASVCGGNSNQAPGTLAAIIGGGFNEANGEFATVTGGVANRASGFVSVVSGGANNTASGEGSSVSGGEQNTASGHRAAVSGGSGNTASGHFASVSGGSGNTASAGQPDEGIGDNGAASVSGGRGNTASGHFSSVSGGSNRTAEGDNDWRGGRFFSDD